MPISVSRKPRQLRTTRRKKPVVSRRTTSRVKRRFVLSDAEIARINGAEESLAGVLS